MNRKRKRRNQCKSRWIERGWEEIIKDSIEGWERININLDEKKEKDKESLSIRMNRMRRDQYKSRWIETGREGINVNLDDKKIVRFFLY